MAHKASSVPATAPCFTEDMRRDRIKALSLLLIRKYLDQEAVAQSSDNTNLGVFLRILAGTASRLSHWYGTPSFVACYPFGGSRLA